MKMGFLATRSTLGAHMYDELAFVNWEVYSSRMLRMLPSKTQARPFEKAMDVE